MFDLTYRKCRFWRVKKNKGGFVSENKRTVRGSKRGLPTGLSTGVMVGRAEASKREKDAGSIVEAVREKEEKEEAGRVIEKTGLQFLCQLKGISGNEEIKLGR